MATARLAVDEDRSPKEDHFVHLHGVTWADYQRLLAIRGEKSAPRLTYLEGQLEIMSPSRSHEWIKSVIARLVEVWCLEHGVEFSPYGSWTLQNRRARRGAEPDECYVFGEPRRARRPHLAIEVVWTSGGIDKLEVYRRLDVREVWYWERGRIQPYALRGGRYVATKRSLALPGLDLAQLARFVARSEGRSTSRTMLAYRAALRRSRS